MLSFIVAQVGEGFDHKIKSQLNGKRVLYISRYKTNHEARKQVWVAKITAKTRMSVVNYETMNDDYDVIVLEEIPMTTLNIQFIRRIIGEFRGDKIIRLANPPSDIIKLFQLKVVRSL